MATLDLWSFVGFPAIEINWIAVIVAAVAGMVVGYIWYGPFFEKHWLALVNMSKEDAQKQARAAMGMAIVAALITAFVLSHVVDWVGAADIGSGIVAGVIVWLGFSATVIATIYGFTQKPMSLFWIDAGNQLVTLAVMGAILAVWA